MTKRDVPEQGVDCRLDCNKERTNCNAGMAPWCQWDGSGVWWLCWLWQCAGNALFAPFLRFCMHLLIGNQCWRVYSFLWELEPYGHCSSFSVKRLIILIMLVPLLNHEDQESSPPTRWNPAHKILFKETHKNASLGKKILWCMAGCGFFYRAYCKACELIQFSSLCVMKIQVPFKVLNCHMIVCVFCLGRTCRSPGGRKDRGFETTNLNPSAQYQCRPQSKCWISHVSELSCCTVVSWTTCSTVTFYSCSWVMVLLVSNLLDIKSLNT